MKELILVYIIISSALFLGAGLNGLWGLSYKVARGCLRMSREGATAVCTIVTGVVTMGFAMGLFAAIAYF